MDRRTTAVAALKRTLITIAVGAVLLTCIVLGILAILGPLHTHMVVATIGGVFVSTVLGCGLFSLAFFSDRSGHDQHVTEATNLRGDEDP